MEEQCFDKLPVLKKCCCCIPLKLGCCIIALLITTTILNECLQLRYGVDKDVRMERILLIVWIIHGLICLAFSCLWQYSRQHLQQSYNNFTVFRRTQCEVVRTSQIQSKSASDALLLWIWLVTAVIHIILVFILIIVLTITITIMVDRPMLSDMYRVDVNSRGVFYCLCVALTDSPAGLLAYILEKFPTWTNPENKLKPDGGLQYRFTRDQLIDNLMLYWVPRSITTSMRFYAENMSNKARDADWYSYPSQVPTWVFQAKYELAFQPEFMLRSKYPNLLNVTAYDDGGHFLALELPKVFAEDVFKAVDAFRNWRKATKTEL